MDIGSDRLPNGTNVAKARRLDMLTSRIKAAAASASNAQLNSEQQPTSSKVNCSICGVIGGVEDRWTSTGICPKCSQKQPPCGVCQNPVGKQQTHIRCFSCTSFVHVHCASTVSLQSPAQYVCPPCQQRSRMPMTPQQSAANPEELARIIQSGQINPVIHQALAQAFGPPDVILQQFGQFSKAASVRPFNESPQSSSDTLTLNDLDDTASLSQNVSRSATPQRLPRPIPSTRRGKESSRGGRAGKKKPGAVGGRQSARTRNAGGKPASAIAYLSDKGSNPTGKGGKGGKARGRSQKGKGKSTPRTRKTRSVNDLSKILNRNDEGVENEDPKVRAADENDYIRTPIVTSAFDTYVKEAPLCLVCGSIGKDVEGTMLSCSTCAQSYHTYCVGMHDKMSTTILKRGWRCLDCTICEGCGDGKDESKLLLCDECDMAFHTYCLNPPLHSIPPGSWRCKWCTTCARCNCLVSSAYELQLSEGFCGPCYSQRKCPKCKKLYETGELMIRCQHCTRWLHGRCEDLSTEEALENASENAFRCSMCRPKADAMASTMLIDNVLLTKTALDEMSQRHGNHFLRSTSSMSFGAIVDSYHRSHSFDNDGFLDDGSIDDRADTDFVVSRGRGRGGMRGSRMPRLGVGGFIVKQPRHRMLAAQNMEEEEGDGDLQNGKSKIKRPRKPRKPPLEECYPPQIQESFFGMHPVDSRTLEAVEEPMLDMYLKTGLDKEINKTGCALSGEVAEQLANEDMMIDDADLMGLDMDIDMDFNLLMDEDDEALNQMLGDNDDLNDALDIAHSDPLFESTRPLQPMIDQHHQMAHGVPVGFHNPHGPQHLQLQMQRQQQQPAGAPNQRGYGVQKAKPDIEKGNQATERWQEDEPLGDKATKAAVLYANVTFPNLKNEYPEWSERQKQITRLWRALGQEERLKYVARARENRTNRTKMARPLKKASESTPITSNVLPSGMNPTAQSMVMQQMGGMRQPHQIKLEMPAQVPNVPTQAFKVPTVPSTPLDQGPSGFPIQMQQQQMRVMNQPGAAQFVPQSAGIPAAQQVHIPPNLPSELLEQYNLLQKRTTDLELQQSSIEDDLTKMRKLKKSLTAKRRQLQKSASSEGQGLDPSISSVDLNDTDLQQLDRLTDGIPIRQRALEECRKELRVHKSNVMEFEGKCGIQGIQRPTSSAPSPQHPFPSQSPAVAIKTEIDFSSGPPTPSSGRPGSSASFTAEMIFQQQNFALQQQQQVQQAQPTKRGRKRKPKIEEPPVAARPAQPMPTLGGISLLQLQTDEEIGAYFVLNDLVNKAVRMVDGSEPEDGIHKILQQATAGLGPGRGPMGLNFPSLQQMPVLGEPSKTKKKRTQQPKKPPGNISDGTDEYTMFVQRIETQLRLCPVIPPLLQNPSSKRSKGDQYMLQHMDLSTLPDKGPQKAVIGNEFGCISLNFVRDFYDDFENRRHRISSAFPSQVMLPYASTSAHPPSMSMVCREAHLGNLMHYPGGLSDGPILFYDENEGMDTYAEAGYNLIGLRPWSLMTSQGQYPQPPMVRAIHRFVDRQQPMPSFSDPGRIAMIESEISCFDDCPEVTVGITIHDGADVSKVVGCLKEILGNDVASYDVAPMSPMIRTDSVVPEHMAMNGIAEEVRTQICRQCSTPMRDAAIQQSLNQMGIAANENTSDDKENTVSFCSMQCYYTFVADRKIPLTPEQVQDAEQYVDKPTLVKLQQVAAENFARCLNQGKLKSVDMSYGPRIVCPPHPSVASISNAGFNPLSPIIGDAPTSLGSVANVREMMLRVSDLPSLIDDHQRNPAAASRKPDQKPVWKGRGWTVCDFDLLESFTKSRKEAKCLCIADQIRANERNKIRVEADLRQCVLCSDIGDGEVDVCGRLLNFDADKWVHVNCALWSPEVAEINGGLQNVDEAIKRGQKLNCRLCGRPGATLVCAKQDCSQVNGHYHLKCAIRANGRFVRDKTFFCNEHEVREDQRVYALSALRRIYIEKDENRLIAKLFQSGATPNASTSGLLMRVGSLIFSRIGQLLPEQLKNFHSQANIFPSDLSGERRQAIYPRVFRLHRFAALLVRGRSVRYDCTIVDIGRQPQFQISFSRKVYKDVTATQAWMPILTSVKRMRDENGEVLKMFPSQMSGEELFGLNEPVISKLTESLPGVDQLLTYNFKHSGSPLMDLPLAENPSGCARCEPYFRTFVKQKKTRWQITPQKSRPAHNFAAPASSSACVDLMATSSSRETRARHASSVNAVLLNCDQTIVRQLRASGMSDEAIASAIGGQTTTANFSQYKKMTKEWRNNVYLARSKIQGLGLYAKRDIDMNSMVIEYIGEIIRSEVGEVREKRYIAQNRGVYMFRIDEQTLVDATMTGGLARYINHSCDPNCSTKVVTYSDEKHIIIYANRPIKADEELTYDYLFEEEEHSEKIACLCGAPNCAKFMN
ncbi:hypothetical protein L596_018797 [Steinernema carpocapsae]|uniref:Histone-lysine N-methyltransferase n=1 Tax=Steinernema carpocapsae TaxID=34508 RepID=A0A4U5N677_STECR|nr:hypothetical protein L596_018797 [Steinernema carpocapsae]